MNTYSRIALLSVLLTGALSPLCASADTLPLDKPAPPYTYELKPIAHNTAVDANGDSSLGLKLGTKSKIELYGTVEIGYEHWSQKN